MTKDYVPDIYINYNKPILIICFKLTNSKHDAKAQKESSQTWIVTNKKTNIVYFNIVIGYRKINKVLDPKEVLLGFRALLAEHSGHY